MRHSTADTPQGMASATARDYRTTRARLLHTSPSSPSLPPSPDNHHRSRWFNREFFHIFFASFSVSLREKQRIFSSFIRTRVCASESADCLLSLNHAKKEKNVFFEFFSSPFSSLFMIYYVFSIFTVIFFCCEQASNKTRITEWKINAGQSYRFILLQRMNSAAGIKL